MNTTSPSTASDLIGSWRIPEAQGVELGCYFYPDGVFVMQNWRHKKFAMQGVWTLEEGGRLVITDVVDPDATRPEAERELIRSERHHISITKISRDSMTWKPEEAREEVAFRREGELPVRRQGTFWKRLLGA